MPRPRRNADAATVRLQAFVHPDTLSMLRAKAEADGTSIGAVVDRLATERPAVGFQAPATLRFRAPLPSRGTATTAVRRHTWQHHPTLGKLCSVCHQPSRSASYECPGDTP